MVRRNKTKPRRCQGILSTLEERFCGTVAEDPIKEADIRRFERKWKRSVPAVLRELLLELNGVIFEPEVEFRKMPDVNLLSLFGMDSVLRSQGEYMLEFLIPVAASLTHGTFHLDSREENSEVYHLTPIVEYSPDRIVLEKVAINLEDFVAKLRPTSKRSRLRLA
jgi:hypothetical protein